MTQSLFDPVLLKKASGILNVLDQDVLLQILKVIHRKGTMTVTEIYIHFKSDQPTISQHLRKLREAGFVTTSRKGKYIYYAVDYKGLQKVQDALDTFMKDASDLYLAAYSEFARASINSYKRVAADETYEGILFWTKSFTRLFQKYDEALEEKEKELLRNAKKKGQADILHLKNGLAEIRKESIRAFWRKHKL